MWCLLRLTHIVAKSSRQLTWEPNANRRSYGVVLLSVGLQQNTLRRTLGIHHLVIWSPKAKPLTLNPETLKTQNEKTRTPVSGGLVLLFDDAITTFGDQNRTARSGGLVFLYTKSHKESTKER